MDGFTALGTVAAFLAFFVKGLTGFANTLIFTGIMSFRTANRNISPVELLLGLPSNIAITWAERRNIRVRIVAPLAVTLLLGLVPGALLLRGGDERGIKLLLGGAVILLAVEMFLRGRGARAGGERREPRPAVLYAIGVLAGFFCGLFGVGAFLVAYVDRTARNTGELRGNLCFVFLLESTARVVLYTALGLLGTAALGQALLLLPGMAAGLLAGLFCAKRLPEAGVKLFINALLLAMGISTVITNYKII